jgi:twitching motility protein PilT
MTARAAGRGHLAAPDHQGDEAGYHINQLLEQLLDTGGSDLHLAAGAPPQIRINGELLPVEGYDRLQPGPLRGLVYGILTSRQREQLEENLELDSHLCPARGGSANVFGGAVGAVMRAIPSKIPGLEGQLLTVCGSSRSSPARAGDGDHRIGQVDDLAAMIDEINMPAAASSPSRIDRVHHHHKRRGEPARGGVPTPCRSPKRCYALRQTPT